MILVTFEVFAIQNNIREVMLLQVIPALLNLMEQGTELVFGTSEILLAILNEVDDEWRKNMLIGEYLVQDILLMVDELRCDEVKKLQSIECWYHPVF